MPYAVKKSGKKWVVYNKNTGEIKSHHATKALAQSSMRARIGSKHGWKPTGRKRVSRRK